MNYSYREEKIKLTIKKANGIENNKKKNFSTISFKNT